MMGPLEEEPLVCEQCGELFYEEEVYIDSQGLLFCCCQCAEDYQEEKD
jgi:formylmethanofuran dehydrogenase subunit E